MIVPKKLVQQLDQHWEVVEELAKLSREFPAFDLQQLELVINQYNKKKNADNNSVLVSLISAGILHPLSRSSDHQLNPLVMDFVRGLTQEHELGLSNVLKARIEAIKQATGQILTGLENSDNDLLRGGADRLTELLRKISQQLTQDKQAIFEIAERAKSIDTAMPMERRYREVLEVYDQYIEPMNEMMDSGLGGNFYPLLENAEQALDKVVDTLSIRGALYQLQLSMRQISYMVKELRYQGRIVAQQCSDTLLPLREEARQHNRLSSIISLQLSQVRKKGLARALCSKELPVWQSRRTTRVQLGDKIRELMANFMNFEPVSTVFPDEEVLTEIVPINRIDEEELRNHLLSSLPINDLMIWLKQHYPDLPDAELLRLYHTLTREKQWQSTLSKQLNTTRLNTIEVNYHPHELSQLNTSPLVKEQKYVL